MGTFSWNLMRFAQSVAAERLSHDSANSSAMRGSPFSAPLVFPPQHDDTGPSGVNVCECART